MVKSALLYADKVELVDPAVVWTSTLTRRANLPPALLAQELLYEEFGVDEDQVWAGRASTVQENAFLYGLVLISPSRVEFEDMLALLKPTKRSDYEDWIDSLFRRKEEDLERAAAERERLQAEVTEVLVDSGHQELYELTEAGVVYCINAYLSMDEARTGDFSGFEAMLKRRLENPESRLMLDSRTAGLARDLIHGGVAAPPLTTLRRSLNSQIGAGMIARLPAFPNATTRDVLRLRDDLQEPLTRYRRAVVSLESRLKSGPFDTTLQPDLDDLWLGDVAPSIAQIRAGLESHSFVRELARQSAMDAKGLLATGGGIWLALGSLTSLNEAVVAASGAAGGMLPTTIRAALESQKQRTAGQRHDLFYAFELQRRLAP